jgi:MFS superfamily sulfate permease-like transporter
MFIFVSISDSFAGIQVGVSVFKILLHVTRPNTLIMGNIRGTNVYQCLGRYKETSRVPSFLILAIESPIYFANSTYLQERLVHSPTCIFYTCNILQVPEIPRSWKIWNLNLISKFSIYIKS